jgi:hypothetical protein
MNSNCVRSSFSFNQSGHRAVSFFIAMFARLLVHVARWRFQQDKMVNLGS